MREAIKEIITGLVEKSKNRNASWSKTSSDNEFKIVLGSGKAFTVDSWNSQNNGTSMFDYCIYNDNGESIVRETFDAADGEDFVLLKELHSSAKNLYYKVDETLEDMLAEIKSKEFLGNKEAENDDLPF